MQFELWWLLGIPIFFGLGWIAARVDIRQLLSESRTLPRSYFKGLNFLLNEQSDKAVDAFIDIVQLDPESIELHLALGNLFRRRGETERAVRIHQNLLVRFDLSEEEKNQAQYELGQDYLKAGLLDRAEETFHLLQDTSYGARAGRALLEIYQREKEWVRAIEAAQTLQASGAGSRQKEIAQFYCELAADKLVQAHYDAAMDLLNQALMADRNSIRATMLIGEVYFAQGEIEAALSAWRRVEQQSILHVALVAQRLLDGYQIIQSQREGVNLLRAYLAEAPSIDLLAVVFKAVLELEGVEAAEQLVGDELRRMPTLLGLDKFLEALMLNNMLNAPPALRSEFSLIKTLVHNYAQKLARYQCTHCGFKVRQFYWYCPGCHHWDTYPPRRTEELTNQLI